MQMNPNIQHDTRVSFLPPPQVVLEGIRGPGIEGDIAIDDVTLEEGECRDPPPSE